MTRRNTLTISGVATDLRLRRTRQPAQSQPSAAWADVSGPDGRHG
jgi:hypothetical protein